MKVGVSRYGRWWYRFQMRWRDRASISSSDSWVGAVIWIFTVLLSWVECMDEESAAWSLPAPPWKRIAGLAGIWGLTTSTGIQKVPQVQHSFDWS